MTKEKSDSADSLNSKSLKFELYMKNETEERISEIKAKFKEENTEQLSRSEETKSASRTKDLKKESSKEFEAAVLDDKSQKPKFTEDLTEKAIKIHEENNLKKIAEEIKKQSEQRIIKENSKSKEKKSKNKETEKEESDEGKYFTL